MTEKKKNEFMRRCLELAQFGGGKVSPNPMVGCVIVRNGKIIGEGYHRYFGGPHAEVYALRQAGSLAKGASLFVNLEPCSHFGKTPPCADAIVAAGIQNVYIAAKDPNPLVSGKGIQKLHRAGIDVEIGLLQKNAEALNEKFMTFMKTGLPFVAVKIAQTIDGKIADAWGNSKWISSAESRHVVHQMRSQYDAVLVGASTVKNDNPALTVRTVKGRNPIRVIVDGNGSLPFSRKIYDTTEAQTIVLTSHDGMKRNSRNVHQMEKRGVCVLAITDRPSLAPKTILNALAKINITSVLIEGGSKTIQSFLDADAVQKLYCFVAPKILGSGLTGLVKSKMRLDHVLQLKNISYNVFDRDIFIEGYL